MNDSITQEEHSILGLKWEDGLPFGLFLNLRNNYYEKVNLVNLRLSNRNLDPVRNICLNYRPDNTDQSGYSKCLKFPVKGRKCDPCKAEEQIFAAGLHHAHKRDRGSLNSKVLKHLERPNYLYVAVFQDGSIKVGTSTADRIETRLHEQGAFLASIICETIDGFLVRSLEDIVTDELGIVQAISIKKKMNGLLQPLPRNEIGNTLENACAQVEELLNSLSLAGFTMVMKYWENSSLNSETWQLINHYPSSLRKGAHDLILADFCGRIAAFQRENDPSYYAVDLGELFGVVVEFGLFQADDLNIQGHLF